MAKFKIKIYIKILCISLIVAMGIINIQNKILEKIYRERKIAVRNNMLFLTLNAWLHLSQKGRNLVQYFENHGYYNIAIYGMGNIGERLYDELCNTNINVKYGIDRNAKRISTSLKVYLPEEDLEKVDIIVVTAINFFDEIKNELRKRNECPIVSIKDIIDEVS